MLFCITSSAQEDYFEVFLKEVLGNHNTFEVHGDQNNQTVVHLRVRTGLIHVVYSELVKGIERLFDPEDPLCEDLGEVINPYHIEISFDLETESDLYHMLRLVQTETKRSQEVMRQMTAKYIQECSENTMQVATIVQELAEAVDQDQDALLELIDSWRAELNQQNIAVSSLTENLVEKKRVAKLRVVN